MRRKAILTGVLIVAIGSSAFADISWGFNIGFGHRDRHRRHGHGFIRPRVFIHSRPRGHWETVTRRVWVPGRYENEWVPEETERVYIRGHYDAWGNYVPGRTEIRVIRPARWERVWKEGYYKTVTERVWVNDRCGRR